MRRLLRLVNEISLAWMFVAIAGVIVGFAGAYWALDHFGVGLLEFTYETDRSVSFADALYFSLVTVSSLGYGDIRPIGWTRLFVGAEVTLGLSFFGLLVAKISSVKQDYILRRMYYSELIDRRLEKLVEQLEEYRKLYRVTSDMLLSGEIDPELTHTFKANVEETTLFYQVHTLLHEIDDIMQFEISNGGFFGDVSDALVSKVYASVQGMLDHTLELTQRDFEGACEHVLCGNEPRLAELAELAEDIARMGRNGSRNREIVEQCDDILAKAGALRRDVFARMGTGTA